MTDDENMMKKTISRVVQTLKPTVEWEQSSCGVVVFSRSVNGHGGVPVLAAVVVLYSGCGQNTDITAAWHFVHKIDVVAMTTVTGFWSA